MNKKCLPWVILVLLLFLSLIPFSPSVSSFTSLELTPNGNGDLSELDDDDFASVVSAGGDQAFITSATYKESTWEVTDYTDKCGIIDSIYVKASVGDGGSDEGGTYKISVRIDGTSYYSDEQAYDTGGLHVYMGYEWAVNPADSEAWEWSDINDLEIGIAMKYTADVDQTRCDYIHGWINYTSTFATDYTIFTEVDPDSDITVSNATRINATCDSQHDAYVYRNFTTGYFRNFNHRVNVRWVSRTAKNTALAFWELSNTVDDAYNQFYVNNDEGIVLYCWSDSDTIRFYLVVNNGTAVSSDFYQTSFAGLNKWYYFNVTRNSTHISAKMYSNKERTDLIDTLTVSYISTHFALLYALNSWNPNIAAEGVWNISTLIISTNPSTYVLNGLSSPYGITWEGVNGSTVCCNSSGYSNEWLELNMTINGTDNVTEIQVFVSDLYGTGFMVNASNISLYVSYDNISYGSMGAFDDGGSNISITKATWPAGGGDNPFNAEGLTDKNESIWFIFRVQIPSICPSDTLTSLTTTTWKVRIGYA